MANITEDLIKTINDSLSPLGDNVKKFLCDSIELFISRSFELIDKCETPIEQLLAIALFSVKYLPIVNYPCEVLIKPQETLECSSLYEKNKKKKYRVDFLIIANKDGKEFKYVIECDGHDFHEKTKEQALKDKKRDRNLMFNGYQIIRFTGSEIWADPAFCAFDVYRVIAKNS